MAEQQWNADLYDTRHSFVSAYGADLLELLDARPGEHVLDAGCGTGELTAALRDAGVEVIGIDTSPDMVERGRQRFPDVDLRVADLRDLGLHHEFDAVFSNAVLHWIPEAGRAAAAIHAALRPGGRLVAELGGAGNIAAIDGAVRSLRAEQGLDAPEDPWYFPGIADYAAVLERAGLETTGAWLFDRPTRLEGDDGLAAWVRMFGSHLLAGIEDPDGFLTELRKRLRPVLYRDGTWWADYRRLRVTAVKPGT